MAIQKISVQQLLTLAPLHPVLDVRSPGEYQHAHLPGAISLPLFTDEERKVVGTAYKQQSRETAIKIGLDYFGTKMRRMVETVEQLFVDTLPLVMQEQPKTKRAVIVHCWRGGMRSAGVGWLLDLYGFKVYTLEGGYKNYRQWVRMQFEKPYRFNLVGGYTGSGKTPVLQQLKRLGKPVIDLEGLANHKGSAFGALGEQAQPSQEMFENLLAAELAACHEEDAHPQPEDSAGKEMPMIYIEDESQRIGQLNIPLPLWNTMRDSQVSFVEIPFEERLAYLTKNYGKFEKEKLVNAIIRIQKRLGGLDTKNAINFLLENNHFECFRILLRYYDKSYQKSLNNRNNLSGQLNKYACTTVDIHAITNLLFNAKTTVD